MAADSKIPNLIIDNAQKLLQKVIPPISQTLGQIGISPESLSNPSALAQELAQEQATNLLNKACLPKDELEKIVTLRNTLINKINSVAKITEKYSKVLPILQETVDKTNTGLSIAKTTTKIAEAALIAIPPSVPIPFSVLNTYIKADKLINTTLPPILTQNINKVSSISTTLDYANNITFSLVNYIKLIDRYLIGCGISDSSLTSTNDYINSINKQYTQIQNKPNETIYKGFTLEIIEEPYSPTVNRRRAVAKNNQNIILLQTPLTFSTDTQTLINEIKLLIDSNNLKAY